MASTKTLEQPVKFTREFFTTDPDTGAKILESRWHYDTKKNPYGPVLVENFITPEKKKKEKSKKL